ncbi:hypothetical protein [Nocardiopsis eucommiae]|uniref:hypothetical protein n=1 Tax=Nocardiopsis eucommiae TaxID=2831970 RepID=UPI003D7219E2
MDLTLIEAWNLWWSGKQLTDHSIHGMPVLWASRLGKIMAFLAGTTIVIDVLGVDRINRWASRRGEFPEIQSDHAWVRSLRFILSVVIGCSVVILLAKPLVVWLGSLWWGKVLLGGACMVVLVQSPYWAATFYLPAGRFESPIWMKLFKLIGVLAASSALVYFLISGLPGSDWSVLFVAALVAFVPGLIVGGIIMSPIVVVEYFAYALFSSPRVEKVIRGIAIPAFFAGFGLDYLAS